MCATRREPGRFIFEIEMKERDNGEKDL